MNDCILTKTVFSPSNKWQQLNDNRKNPTDQDETNCFPSCDLLTIESLDNDIVSEKSGLIR